MTISVYIAVSTNGLISNSRNVADWLSEEYGQGLYAMCQQAKAVIMGKTTYAILAPDHLPLKQEGTTVVMTSDKQATSANSTVIFTQATPAEISQLFTDKGHGEAVIIGGAVVISEFVKAGLVTDLYLVVEPVLFGNGLPLLNEVALEVKLRLVDVTNLNDSSLRLHYSVQA